MNEINIIKNIHQRLKAVQSNEVEILKEAVNKGQSYNYYTELQVLTFLKPLLSENGLSLYFEDLPELEYKLEERDTARGAKEWFIQYWKQATLTNVDKPEETIKIKFLSTAKNVDPAKAKGSAETYAVKYLLTKFFLIPIADNLDPDREQWTSKGSTEDLNEKDKKLVDDLLKKHKLTTNTGVASTSCFPTGGLRCFTCKEALISKGNNTWHCAKCNKDTTITKK